MDYKSAKILLSEGIPNSIWFKENNYPLEYSYSLLIEKNLEMAEKTLKDIAACDIRADWLYKIIPILKNNTFENKENVKYLQVRNFLEPDLNMLIKSKNYQYAQSLADFGEYFFDVCEESYKFIGRAFYYNNMPEIALKFFEISKDRKYNDSELHFLLGNLFFDKHEKENCQKALKTCLKLIPEYQPAIDLLKESEKI